LSRHSLRSVNDKFCPFEIAVRKKGARTSVLHNQMRKRTRKQPRRLTPPLFLRTEEGDRSIIEVDTQTTITNHCTSTRLSAILRLDPGLDLVIGSRSINKRRVTVIHIKPTQ
jgi:hypothetical protein